MAIYTEEEARKIMEKALGFSKADACEINLDGSESGNIRYARNSVSTAGHRSNQTMVVQSNFGKKMGTATIDEFDEESFSNPQLTLVNSNGQLIKRMPSFKSNSLLNINEIKNGVYSIIISDGTNTITKRITKIQ